MALLCDYLDFGSPFNDSDADVILRSRPVQADVPLEEIRTTATHFRVHKLFLIKASPVFERLLSETSSISKMSRYLPWLATIVTCRCLANSVVSLNKAGQDIIFIPTWRAALASPSSTRKAVPDHNSSL